MRKAVAGALIKLAHRIFPPKVTEFSWTPATTVTLLDPHKTAEAFLQRTQRFGSGRWN